jgi:hemin uptake protein HemP
MKDVDKLEATQRASLESPTVGDRHLGGHSTFASASAERVDALAGETGELGVSAMGVASSLPKIISFSSLVRCGDEVWIEHGGSLYRLRRTKQDKLILTK